MNPVWYLNRLKKMGLSEVLKRLKEHLDIYYSRIKYRDPFKWPYWRFARDDIALVLNSLPGIPVADDWKHYWIYNTEFDLTEPIDWYFSDNSGKRWPECHYARINYRPGNPYGDVRINWELSRLQFLPAMAVTDEDLAKSILADWLVKNPYLHGPGYLASMEVALRWISIYWAVCLFKKPIDVSLQQNLAGLAIASGKFIESRFSTHSSAGNHLIVEAVGLFWIGKALQKEKTGKRWLRKAQEILWKQTLIQLNPDGTNKEQSFWYLGFVVDALFHYLLLEDRQIIPGQVISRIEKATEFMHEMILPDGSFPDYGDRDDGVVFRVNGACKQSPFSDLLNIDTFFFNCSDVASDTPQLKTYADGGMTLMKWDKCRLLFRHAPLGMGNTCGHGHADALSILFSWNNTPVLIDLGSGQYNGNQYIRNFFRSTIAHNTVEIGSENQAKIIGPFMWEKTYEICLTETEKLPSFFVEAYHTGYKEKFGIVHKRKIEWLAPYHIEIGDVFSGFGGVRCKGAFHLGACKTIVNKGNSVEAEFDDFIFSITFPSDFTVDIFHGSEHPFMGWRSTIYGVWEPIYSIVFSFQLSENYHCKTILNIVKH